MRASCLPLLLLATLTSCAAKESDYVDPPGFTPRDTLDVAVAPGTFLVDGGRVVSSTLADRVLQRRFAGLADDDPSPWLSDQLRLEVTLGATYAEGTRAAVSWRPRAWATFRPLGGSAEARPLPRQDGAIVAYPNAYPGVVAAFGGSSRQLKEFLRVEQPGAAPELRYAVDRGPELGALELSDGELWAYDVEGNALFAVMPPVVRDAQGTEVRGTWEVQEEGGQTLVRAALSYAGLVYPLMIDPSFDTPLWKADNRNTTAQPLPPARGAAAIAYSRIRNEVFMFGGVSGTNYLDDLRARYFGAGSTSLWRPADLNANMAASAARPSKRAYAAMAAIDAGSATSVPMYLFGGQTDAGQTSDELWKVTIGQGNTPTWTKIAYPPTKDATSNWPSARILHGLALVEETKLLLFGGVDTKGNLLTDTWSWDHATQKWTRLCDACFPGAYGFTTVPTRTRDVATYDRPVVFGGYDGASYSSAVHRWTGTTWEAPAIADALVPTDDDGLVASVAAGGAVSPRARFLGFGFWTATGNVLLGGGVQTDPAGVDAYINDAWAWQTPGKAGGDRWVREASNLSLGLPGYRESAAAVAFELTAASGDGAEMGLVFGGVTDANTGAVTNSTRLYRANTNAVSLTVRTGDVSGTSMYRLATAVTTTSGNPLTNRQAYFVRRKGGVWEPVPGCGSVSSPITTTAAPGCDTPVADNGSTDAFGVMLRNADYYTKLLGTPGAGCSTDGTSTDAALCGPVVAYPGQATCGVNGSTTASCLAVPVVP